MLPSYYFYWFRIDNKHMTEPWLDQALMYSAYRSGLLRTYNTPYCELDKIRNSMKLMWLNWCNFVTSRPFLFYACEKQIYILINIINSKDDNLFSLTWRFHFTDRFKITSKGYIERIFLNYLKKVVAFFKNIV